jgi:hypothetical protein
MKDAPARLRKVARASNTLNLRQFFVEFNGNSTIVNAARNPREQS